MKKLISLAMIICLAATMILPAAATDAGLDKRLALVTLAVKQTLSIGDEYTEFSSHLTEGKPESQWNLNWKGDKASLDVTVTEAGKIVSYYLNYNENTYLSPSGDLKKFPKLSRTQAKKIAQTFLGTVLDTPIESADLEEGQNLIAIYDNGNYNFYGTLKLNGLKTPVYINLTVNSAKQVVTSFYRSDSGVDYATFPAVAKVTKDTAAHTLFDSVTMQLNYVISDKNEKQAILRYSPEMKADYVVDALTGVLVERKPQFLYKEYGASPLDQSSAKSGGGLTDVELQAVTDLKGSLSSATLEAAARGISELGISSGLALANLNYYKEKSDNDVAIYANLIFSKQSKSAKVGAYSYIEKSVMLNAKTGEFISSWSSYSSDQTPTINYSQKQSEQIARAFAAKYHSDELKVTALSESQAESNDRYQTLTFVRQANGIAFPANAITLTVDRTDGTIGSYAVSWDEDITFADPAGIKTMQGAKDIYTKASGLGLLYDHVSTVGEDDSTLRLVYDFVDQSVWGVDAATGSLLTYQTEKEQPLSYGDSTGHFAQKQIETLSEYGIGYIGGSFAPDQTLTQRDALTLIVAASGYSIDQSAKDYEDNLYSAAYSMGILEKTGRNPNSSVSRAQLTKMLVDAAGYGEVAQLKDIYRIGFKDETAIPADLFGYVAIAKGLGIIKGNTSGNFSPNSQASRAQLAIMLFNIMSR